MAARFDLASNLQFFPISSTRRCNSSQMDNGFGRDSDSWPYKMLMNIPSITSFIVHTSSEQEPSSTCCRH
jgi:hypothetical protein